MARLVLLVLHPQERSGAVAMCGISGIVNRQEKAVSLSVLQEMSRCMAHRGPDDESYELKGQAGLGFRRLAIIDLDGGRQPMSNEDDRYWIVFNGEIYNYQTLRQKLESSGRHRFKTQSDTEIILHLFEEYGPDCLRHLRGMFAFAIWDTQEKKLFAARDRFGKKPFFYFVSEAGDLVFASELKALLKHPDCPTSIDPQSIYLYLALQYIPAPRSIYKNVFKLPAAHSLSWSRDKGATINRYWDLRYDPKEDLTYPDAQKRLRATLTECVSLRMIADVPLGAYLSGGIDSSIIVALMAQQSSKPIQTFSIGFDEEAYSEVSYARLVAERYKTDHHEFIVHPQLIDILPKLAWFYSEPFADSSALPSYYLAQQTRQHVTVALTGDGGDELFAGYLRYRAMWAMQFWNRLPQSLRRVAASVGQWIPGSDLPIGRVRRLKRLLNIGAMPEMNQYLRTLEYFHTEEQAELWSPGYVSQFQQEGLSIQPLFAQTLNRNNPSELMDRLMYLDLNHYLPDCLMVKTDIASMANSLEARSPFLDHLLAEECARWPTAWKYQPLNSSKKILKETFADDLPSEILHRGKQGFGVPIAQWFRGALKNYLPDVILSKEALARGYFRPDTLRRYVQEHQSGQRDRSYGLWALLMLELWHRAYDR